MYVSGFFSHLSELLSFVARHEDHRISQTLDRVGC